MRDEDMCNYIHMNNLCLHMEKTEVVALVEGVVVVVGETWD
jgi:hypothetical protein